MFSVEDAETKSLIGVSDVISATLKKQHEASRLDTMSAPQEVDAAGCRPRKRKPGIGVVMTCAHLCTACLNYYMYRLRKEAEKRNKAIKAARKVRRSEHQLALLAQVSFSEEQETKDEADDTYQIMVPFGLL